MVPKYRIDKLAELSRQMAFTPHQTRVAQLDAAEALLHTLDPLRAYPLEFIIFRITGYHPRGLSHELLAGQALQHDLGLLIEQVSQTLSVQTSAISQPVLSIEDLTERLNVASKTIQRWRRRGLPARRFVFPDGKCRVGFLVTSVERFLAAHRQQVSVGANFSQIAETEKDQIIGRARRLARECGCCATEIARRIARKLNRSPLTILHTIRKHDQEHPQQAVLASAAEPLSEAEKQRVLRAYRRGKSLSLIARRLTRPRAMVYRALVDERIERLGRRKVRFIDDALYHQPEAQTVIEQIAAQDECSQSSRPEDHRIPRDLPPYLQDLYRTPLLTPARERALFLKFNFHKYQFVRARRRLDPQFARARQLQELEGSLARANETKNAILQANLRLVVSIARKHLRPELSLMELISDGNLTLMRAVEGFDIHRGNRFSTYATLALMKGFARSVPQMLSGRKASSLDERVLEAVPDGRSGREDGRAEDRDQIRVLLSRLSDRERRVLCAHYGLEKDSASTFEQLGRRFGLSKHRVRQIEKNALAKLRRAAAIPQN